MTRFDCDLAILGSGFGGSLLAIIARKLGYSVVLLERGRHPRFAIGESSTPLADFRLARIADDFGLDWLRPFARYGQWKATYPEISCGLKRGFSFFRQEQGRKFAIQEKNANALLVASSPDDATADTHWLRADFDAHIVGRAVEAGIPYLDECKVNAVRHSRRGWELDGTRPDGAVAVHAELLIDASGTGQALAEALRIEAVDPAKLRVKSRALYSHFTGIARWQDMLEADGGTTATAGHPYPCDAAVLHQIIDGGWMWIIPFDNGITSAGFSLDTEAHPFLANETSDAEWERLLRTYPSLEEQFSKAESARPFVRSNRLQRRLTRAAGADWAMLPHTAGFLDAWLSPGIAQTLYAVNRLGRILAEERSGPARERRLNEYGKTVLRELAWVDSITGTCFACFDRFPVLTTATMIYFTAAIFCEERERRGESSPDEGFLLADHGPYREIADRVFRRAVSVPVTEAERFAFEVRELLAPYNYGGLCDPDRHNMYPFICNLSLAATGP